MEAALIEVEEGHDVGVFLKENERELFVNPLSVCLAEEKVVEKVDGGSFPLKEGRGCGVVWQIFVIVWECPLKDLKVRF